MTTASTRVFDELAKMMTNAAGAAQGARREIDRLVQTQVERVLNDLEVVKREEFEAVKEMAAKAREENDALSARIAKLEAVSKKPVKRAVKKKTD
jgi:BMFP domain-containing protein YqiC